MDNLFAESEQAALKRRVLAEYQKALDQIAPITQQLKRTDDLINAIVYRLYGLTPEEIAIVEGKQESVTQTSPEPEQHIPVFPDAEFQTSGERSVAESKAILEEKEVDL